MSVVSQAHALIQSLFRLVVVALLGTGAYFGWSTWSARDAAERELAKARGDLAQLRSELSQKNREIERLNLALKLLKVDRRVARIVVVDQQPSKTAGRVATRVRFEEVDGAGNPIGTAREYTIEGDLLYVDAWVVKFEDVFVEQGDPLRAASICQFRRLFGEFQQPSEGFAIDAPGEPLAAYGGGREPSELEAKVWSDFWGYANDPQKARQLGIRAAHGEAPSQRLKPGAVYSLTLRSSGGLTFAPEKPDGSAN